jgi:hypothetical protein
VTLNEITGQETAQMIVIVNQNIAGKVYSDLRYVGGAYSFINQEAILDALKALSLDKRVIQFDDIRNKPPAYLPAWHITDAKDIMNLSALCYWLEKIYEAILIGDQRNWAMQNVTYKNEWLFVLDADEEFTPELAEEVLVQVRNAPEDVAAFRVKRKFYLWGKWLKNSSLYPTWVVRLIKNGKVRYVNRGHAETQVIDGRELSLNADLKDENLKGLHAWFDRQNEYSTKESNYEANAYRAPLVNLFSSDALKRREAMKSIARRLPFRPLAFFIYNLIWKRGFLDGYVGFQFSLMKAIYVAMIDLKKYETQKYPHLYSENEVIDSNSKKQTSKTS